MCWVVSHSYRGTPFPARMAPSLQCTANLFCSEVAFEGAWEDDTKSLCENDNLESASQCPVIVLVDPGEVDESIAVLVEKEANHVPQADYLQMFHDGTLDARTRQTAVSWLLKVQAHYNFGPLTAALSVNYLDRYLSRHRMTKGKAWLLQLLSVACLSLAAKMEGTEVPLLDLQIEGAEYIFEPRTVQKMELLVMSTLNWRLSSVTPFCYVEYFISKLGVREEDRLPVASRINDFALNTLEELRFVDHRPSSIAIAATLCAIEELFPTRFEECKEILFNYPVSKDSSESCFNVMNELFVEPVRLNSRYGASCIATVPRSPVRVFDASFSCDSESTMRSLESSPSVVSSPASKKRRIDNFCSTVPCVEAS